MCCLRCSGCVWCDRGKKGVSWWVGGMVVSMMGGGWWGEPRGLVLRAGP